MAINENTPYVLIETREDTSGEIITEQSQDGKKLYLSGIFAQAELVNGNRRRYPKSVMENALDEYIEKYVKRKQALGELNHPKDRLEPDPDRACVVVEKLDWDGNNVVGRAVVADTNTGRNVRGLMEAGWIPGVSSRASGSLKKDGKGIFEVQKDLKFHAIIDVVHNPSAPDAYVSGIYESTETGLILVSEDETFENGGTKYKHVDTNNDSLYKFARKLLVESKRINH